MEHVWLVEMACMCICKESVLVKQGWVRSWYLLSLSKIESMEGLITKKLNKDSISILILVECLNSLPKKHSNIWGECVMVFTVLVHQKDSPRPQEIISEPSPNVHR
jgi:hypothetical protein